ncbi:methyltransferase domain-containing protein [Microdochium nivale]|nr:methyltransferase domain-containing protein [Microdochium nivale]
MAEQLMLLPATTYKPPKPAPVRRHGVALNTIIEEDSAQRAARRSGLMLTNLSAERPSYATQTSQEKIAQWLSPQSDHFPTPRGFHFMSAPILPESPSAASMEYDGESIGNNSPSTSFSSSNPWNRMSASTVVTEFDDIYDVSDDEDRRKSFRRTGSIKRYNSNRSSIKRNLTPLTIPEERESSEVEPWSGATDFKKLTSPVPVTPSHKVEMSPAVMSYMQAQQIQEVPTISAPPSLDGSLSSEQMATMSAPPTPIIGAEDDPPTADWSGVHLQPGALETLHALSAGDDDEDYHPEQVIEISEERMPEMSQQTPRAITSSLLRPTLRLSTGSPQEQQQQSTQPQVLGLSALDIPSPGGFFNGLSPRTRDTWHTSSTASDDDDIAPPTSTTAEQFYRCPWTEVSAPPPPPIPRVVVQQHQPIRPAMVLPPPPPPRRANITIPLPPPPPRPQTTEQLVEIRSVMSDGIPTGRPTILEQVVTARDDLTAAEEPVTARRIPEWIEASISSETLVDHHLSAADEITEIVTTYDPQYTKKMQNEALSNLDRTELWLMAQKVYLQGVQPVEDVEEKAASTSKVTAEVPELDALLAKKTVRFSEIPSSKPTSAFDIPRTLPSRISRQESAYYRAFQDYLIRTRTQDAFVHRQPRFEALQAQRASLRDAHRNQLLGKFQLSVVPQSAKKRMSANVARGDDVLIDDFDKLRHDKEAEAARQTAISTWHVAATKALNGGKLFSAPIAKRLARLSRMGAAAATRARILDLGGQTTCDWAWHCAFTYPNAKVYTVATKKVRQVSNSNIRGPPNHRQVAVERLTRLPFPNEHFDLVSARELQSVLKAAGENGGQDEWDACLAECFRVLKPGGYLDFSVMDSDIVNAGPTGLARSVEFGFALRTMGYEPNPTRTFLSKVAGAGFADTKRAWVCLPMGSAPKTAAQRELTVRDSATGVERSVELEAIVQGSTEAAAGLAGLAGSLVWERWLLRCEMEKLACEGRLNNTMVVPEHEIREAAAAALQGVHGIVEEGRRCGAGWRVLNGFARKPRGEEGVLEIMLDA